MDHYGIQAGYICLYSMKKLDESAKESDLLLHWKKTPHTSSCPVLSISNIYFRTCSKILLE